MIPTATKTPYIPSCRACLPLGQKNINPYAELDIKGQFTRFDHKDMQSGNRA